MNIKYIDMSQPINDQYRLASSDSFLFHKLLFGIYNRKKRKKNGTSSQEWEREESKNVSAFVTDIFIRLFFICHRQFLLQLLHFWNLHLPAGGENNQISLLGKKYRCSFFRGWLFIDQNKTVVEDVERLDEEQQLGDNSDLFWILFSRSALTPQKS